MKRCAYLTMAEPGDFVTDYELSYDAMADLGWRAEPVVWNDPGIDWDVFDAVYICTPWDYPQQVDLANILPITRCFEPTKACCRVSSQRYC